MNQPALHATQPTSGALTPIRPRAGLSGPGTEQAARPGNPNDSAHGSEPDVNPALPTLTVPIPPSEVLSRLLATAKRGRLAGYEAITPAGGNASTGTPMFRVSVFGEPYDRELIATITPTPDGGSCITFRSRLLRKLPAIAVVLTLLSIQPGMWLTDSMLGLYWAWYHQNIKTWWWYLPLVLMSVPMLWKQFRKSEAAAALEARAVVARVADALK